MSTNKELLKALIEELRVTPTIPTLMGFIRSWATLYGGDPSQENVMEHIHWEMDDINRRRAVTEGEETADTESDEIGTNLVKVIYSTVTMGYVAGVYKDPEMAGALELVMGALAFLSQEIGLRYWVEFDGEPSKKEKILPKFLVALSGNPKERLAIFYKRSGIA